VNAARAPSLQAALESWSALQRTRRGFTHLETDAAALMLLELLYNALETEIRALRTRSALPEVTLERERQMRELDAFRIPAGDQPNVIRFGFRASIPVYVNVQRIFQILVPVNPAGEDDLVIADRDMAAVLGARMSELMPHAAPALEARAQMRAKAIVAETLHQLGTETESRLGRA